MTDPADEHFMRLALDLGRRGLGNAWPNPAVGALVVQDGAIVGRGWTQAGGRPHAETEALRRAGAAAKDATLYVTLEPCSHHGKTPPCADAIVAAGIGRVVSALEDPNPKVAGEGYARLRAAGIAVETGICEVEARRAHAGHIRRIRDGRPHVTLKLAVSSDGKSGLAGRRPLQISGAAARARVHLMRAMNDAVLIGIGTALADDPKLTVRLPGLEARSPARIVLDRMARLPSGSKLATTAHEAPVMIAASLEADPARRAILEGMGVRFLATETYDHRIALPELLDDLAAQGLSTLMVEGGAETALGFLEEGLVDRIALFIGPGRIGTGGIAAPVSPERVPAGFDLVREARFGNDAYAEWLRRI